MNLTLQQLFGVNVVETSQTLTIKKSDLLLLTPSTSNTAESLLIAVLLKCLRNFQGLIEDENNNPIQDENSNAIEFDNKDAYTALSLFLWDKQSFDKRNNSNYLRKTIIVEEYTLSEN